MPRAKETDTPLKFIPLDKLKKSPRNARKVPHTRGEIAQLAASIKAHGLIQNPVVEPETDANGKATGFYLVTAGEGRRQALLLLKKRNDIRKTYRVRCAIDAAHDPYEVSLAENAVRSAMHPADQFDAFFTLHTEKGMAADDIAARFGVTPAVVRQRLKLAAVSPQLIAIYRAGDMTLEQLSAFAITDDHAAQERAWEVVGARGSRDDILSILTEAQLPPTDPRALFVGAKAYQAAGGALVQDLFDEDGSGYFADAELVWRLAAEKLERLAEPVKAEGWKWVTPMVRLDHAVLSECRRVYSAPRSLGDDEQKELDTLEAQYEALSYDGTEEAAAEITAIEERVAALVGDPVFDREAIGRAGAIVTIAHDGTLRIERGFVRKEDDVRRADASVKARRDNALSEKLVGELTARRTMALRASLGDAPDVALLAITHVLALEMCFQGAAEHTCLDIRARMTSLVSLVPDIENSVSARHLNERHASWLKVLPDDPAALWAFLAGQPEEQRRSLLAHCAALAVDAVQRPMAPEARAAHATELASVVRLDMAAQWTPTKANYFGRVPKDKIIEAVTEGVSTEAAKAIQGLTKGAMAEAAETKLAGTHWLPALLRTPPRPDHVAKTRGRGGRTRAQPDRSP